MFNIGDHVKVVAGSHQGKTFIVENILGNLYCGHFDGDVLWVERAHLAICLEINNA